MRWLLVSVSSLVLFAASTVAAANYPDLLRIEKPAISVGGGERHPAVEQAIVGSWIVSAGPGLTNADRVAQRNSSRARWVFATGEQFVLPLPGRGKVELAFDALWNPVPGVEVYTGRIEGRQEWLFTLAIDSDEILGRFFIGDRVFILENLANHDHLFLHEMDRSRLPKAPVHQAAEHAGPFKEGDDELSIQSTNPPSCSSFTPSGANGHARVLFLYSSDVATGINSLIGSIVAEFNSSADNSRVELDNFITVADIRQVDDTFEGLCRRPILDQMEDESGVFQGLSQSMALVDADVAFLIVSEDDDATNSAGNLCVPNLGRIGGLAWVLRASGAPAHGLSTSTWALGDLTAVHEIGHIVGGLHEGPVDNPDLEAAFYEAGVPDCAHGYVGSSQEWMTMMGGYVECPFDETQPDPTKQPCTRLPIWSNPALSHDGEFAGDADTAHMALALEMTMPIAAEWDAFPTPKPQSAPDLSVQPQFCFGMNFLSWSEVLTTQVYQLVESVDSTFAFDPLVFFGDGTATFVDVPEGQTRYYRVRACNGNGCGPWSNVVSASYFDGCL